MSALAKNEKNSHREFLDSIFFVNIHEAKCSWSAAANLRTVFLLVVSILSRTRANVFGRFTMRVVSLDEHTLFSVQSTPTAHLKITII